MNRPESAPDLLVVGAGVIGLSAAIDARDRGMKVTVLERGQPVRRATWAAAGMLSPLGEAHGPGAYLEFGLESLRIYPEWVADLEARSGVRVEYHECGKLHLARSDSEIERIETRAGWAENAGISAERLDRDEVRRRVPHLSPRVLEGLLVAADYRVDNRALGTALVEAARRGGVELITGAPVRAVRSSAGRVEGVVLEDGTTFEAPVVLLAAGAWSGSIEGLPEPLPVRPVRGQMLALDSGSGLPPFPHVIECDNVYLVPRDDGRVLVGATQEEAGFREETTAGGIRGLLDAALGLVPELEDAPVVELWSGLRPGTSDGSPVLGPHPEIEGLLLATGHFRNGILLAPATARRLGSLVAGETGTPLPPEFVPERLSALEGARNHA